MKQSLAEKVYVSLRDDIISCEISANEMLTEQMIADKYEVSKAPVRESLHRLCQEGYLISYPRKGYMVNNISEVECIRIQQLRFYLESAVIHCIISNVPDDRIKTLYEIVEVKNENLPKEKNPYKAVNTTFHLAMAKLLDNHYFYDTLYKFVGTITQVVIRYPKMALNQRKDDHRLLIQALLERNEKKAVSLLYDDLSSVFPFEK